MMNLEHLFEEPTCSHNKAKSPEEKKKGCPKPKPGAAAGGCAFDGAQIALLPIADAVHLVHGPIACAGNSWDNRGTRSSVSDRYRMGFTTDISENDVIFGGEKRLMKAIEESVKKYNPPAVFVYATCVTSMIGDDLESICKRAQAKVGVPVIPVNSPGFVGSKNLGNKIAGESLFKYVIGTREPRNTEGYYINLLGEYNIAGELWQIIPIFNELGIKIRACISGDTTYNEVAAAHRARLNMVVCSKALVSLARAMEQKYNIPYFEGSFYGIRDTSEAIMNIVTMIGDEELILKAKKLIEEKEKETREALKPYIEILKGKKVLINTGGVKSWSMVSQVKELGMEVVGTSAKKSTKEDKERMLEIFEGDESKLIDDPNPKELIRLIKEHNVDVLMAGGRSMYVAMKTKVAFLDTNQERIHAYAGYDGMINLAKNLVSAINTPVWKLVKEVAPWQKL